MLCTAMSIDENSLVECPLGFRDLRQRNVGSAVARRLDDPSFDSHSGERRSERGLSGSSLDQRQFAAAGADNKGGWGFAGWGRFRHDRCASMATAARPRKSKMGPARNSTYRRDDVSAITEYNYGRNWDTTFPVAANDFPPSRTRRTSQSTHRTTPRVR